MINEVPNKPEFKSMEDYVIFNFRVTQLKYLEQVKKYLEKHGQQETLEFLAALMDSLK